MVVLGTLYQPKMSVFDILGMTIIEFYQYNKSLLFYKYLYLYLNKECIHFSPLSYYFY